MYADRAFSSEDSSSPLSLPPSLEDWIKGLCGLACVGCRVNLCLQSTSVNKFSNNNFQTVNLFDGLERCNTLTIPTSLFPTKSVGLLIPSSWPRRKEY